MPCTVCTWFLSRYAFIKYGNGIRDDLTQCLHFKQQRIDDNQMSWWIFVHSRAFPFKTPDPMLYSWPISIRLWFFLIFFSPGLCVIHHVFSHIVAISPNSSPSHLLSSASDLSSCLNLRKGRKRIDTNKNQAKNNFDCCFFFLIVLPIRGCYVTNG